MACATLKRSLEFDPVHSHGRPNKRRRCIMPITLSPSTASQSSPSSVSSSPAAAASVSVASQCTSTTNNSNNNNNNSSSSSSNNHTPRSQSAFAEVTSKLTPERMAANLREEIRRLHRRKQLQFIAHSDSSDAESSPGSSPSSSHISSANCRDKPLFTFRQVSLICERMLSEQETKIRDEYDQILHMKLSEQHDAFLKFTCDHLQRRFGNEDAPSYLS